MQGDDQTRSPARRRVGCWLIVAAALLSGPVRAQEDPQADAPARLRDPINLAADKIQTWQDSEGRWYLFTGQVAIYQGDQGLRARQAVVRVRALDPPGVPAIQAEVYAEGNAVPFGPRAKPLRSLRLTFRSNRDVVLKPYPGSDVDKLNGPPPDAPIVRTGFPTSDGAVAREAGSNPQAKADPRGPGGSSLPVTAMVAPATAPPPGVLSELPPAVVASVAGPLPPPAASAPVQPAELPPPVEASSPRQPLPTSATGPAPPLAGVAAPAAPGPAPEPIATLPPIGLPPLPANMPALSAAAATSGAKPTRSDGVVRATGSSGIDDSAGGSGVKQTQFQPGMGFGGSDDVNSEDLPAALGPAPLPGLGEAPEEAPSNGLPFDPAQPPVPAGPGTVLEPLPGPGGGPMPPLGRESTPAIDPAIPRASPILAGTMRITHIFPRDGGPNYSIETLKTQDGVSIMVIRGGVNITSMAKQYGIIDLSADSAIIWRKVDAKNGGMMIGPNGEQIEDAGQPMEVYLEGNVVFLQDERKVAGSGDQKGFRAKRAYYDFRTSRFVGLEGEINMFGPGMISPTRTLTPRIDQFRPLKPQPDGTFLLGLEEIRTDHPITTGSRFPNPGYTFTSQSADMKKVVSTKANPNTGKKVGNPNDPKAQDLTWRIDARHNVFWLGPIPVFYHPRFIGNVDDIEPPVRAFIFRTNNYFGQQFLVDFNGFRIFGIEKPKWVDIWNLDVDELSARGLALGSEVGWFGSGLLNDLTDPYGKVKRSPDDGPGGQYFGYMDIWGLQDHGNDVLGPGPAVITNDNKEANVGLQRTNVPAFQQERGKITFRHMQSFVDPEAEQDEDFRLQTEVGFASDRNFIEEYYKRIFDTGLDQETLAYMIRQQENRAWDLWTEGNLNAWQTETQWLPRTDYYRMGDSLWNNRFTYYQHSGADYANTHPAVEVNNPHLFAFLPYDPITNTSQVLRAGRFYTNHQIDMPLQFDTIRIIPYVQGQAVGWTNQIGGTPVGRVWGAAGARASIMAMRPYPKVESELFNVHGLYHKVNLDIDARFAWSNVKLNQIGVQDDLDDNSYEYVRRYFALTQYAGGLLPPQYDPRHLILRRMLSPISGPTDIQASIDSIQMNLHQRLQTKRGPEGRRRVIDYMTLDLSTTYFPYSQRDNFGKSFGQNMYNWQWFLGDRTSIISYGWFEFWNLGGQPIYPQNVNRHNDPFGLNVITSGISISRPPRGNIYLGYTVIDTGPINTSALTTSISYWLSPKWYGSFSTMYDFGNAILLGENFSFTRIGSDFLTTIGLTVDPQRNSYTFAFMLAPRISPNVRFGSGLGTTNFDSRYAPTQ